MYRLDRSEFTKSRFISLWALLGFQAGFVNAFGFLAVGRFVSHVTGFGTQIGMSMARNEWLYALELFFIPVSFILGAFVSGAVTSARLDRGLKPAYDWVTFMQPALILIVALVGLYGGFGEFGEGLVFQRDFLLLALLAAACGVQNGCFATMTRGQIRTTHLTGISTDIGTDLARAYFGKLDAQEAAVVKRVNISRIATFLAFSLGSILSVIVSSKYNFAALLLPFTTGMIVFFSVARISWEIDHVTNSSVNSLGNLQTSGGK